MFKVLKILIVLMLYLQRKHPDIYATLVTPAAAPPLTFNIQPTVDTYTSSINQPSAESFTTNFTKWKLSDPRQKQLEGAIASMVAHDLLPLRFVDSEKFQAVMQMAEPRFAMPTRRRLRTSVLSTVSADVETKLKLEMQQAQDICLTVDLWSSRDMRSFLGITGHFILDYTLQSIMISCSRFKGSHTGDRIFAVYQETLAHFGIAEKISHIITDNASNMVKAFTLPGMEDLTIDDDDEDEDEEQLEEQPLPDDLEDLQGQRSPCFAHTLQLVVKDGLKEAKQLNKIIKKVSKIVSHCRKSSKSSELLEDYTKLQLANATRWNSQVTMLRSLLKLPSNILDQIMFNADINLTAYEQQLCTELVDVLQPFQLATDLVQGDKVVTASFVISSVKGLRVELKSLQDKYSSKLVTTLQASLEQRLAKYEDMEHFQLATILDPRFKLDWCNEDETNPMKRLITKKFEQLAPSTPCGDLNSPPAKRIKLFGFMKSKSVIKPASSTEVNKYLNLPCITEEENPLDYWKEEKDTFPVLSSLACKYLCIPASSAPVERLFSIAGKVFRPERCRISDERFQQLMMIRCNQQ